MELIRYRPDPALRWLQVSADQIKREAARRGKSVTGQTGMDQRGFGQNLRTAAGALVDYTKGAYAELKHRQTEASEYVLLDEQLDIVNGSNVRSIPYNAIRGGSFSRDRATFVLDKGSFEIRPFAHLVAGRARVPIGWLRNGIDVPFELLAEEIAARAGVTLRTDS